MSQLVTGSPDLHLLSQSGYYYHPLQLSKVSWFEWQIKNAYVKRANTETAQKVVNDVVKFVQQVYADLDGPAKLQKAITEASTILQNKGINITETEINMLIESAVYGIKQSMTVEQLKLKEAQDAIKVEDEVKVEVVDNRKNK